MGHFGGIDWFGAAAVVFFGGGLEVNYLVVVVLLLTCECLCLESAGSVWSEAGSIRGKSE